MCYREASKSRTLASINVELTTTGYFTLSRVEASFYNAGSFSRPAEGFIFLWEIGSSLNTYKNHGYLTLSKVEAFFFYTGKLSKKLWQVSLRLTWSWILLTCKTTTGNKNNIITTNYMLWDLILTPQSYKTWSLHSEECFSRNKSSRQRAYAQ